jgi:hypothetical protein
VNTAAARRQHEAPLASARRPATLGQPSRPAGGRRAQLCRQDGWPWRIGLDLPVIVAAMSLVIGALFLPETKDRDITK